MNVPYKTKDRPFMNTNVFCQILSNMNTRKLGKIIMSLGQGLQPQ